MLYFLALFIAIASAVPQSITVGIGNEWTDFVFCDRTEWVFDSQDQTVYSAHRDGTKDLLSTCYYGEFAGAGPNENQWGFTYFNLVDNSGAPILGQVKIIVSARLWAFCNWQTTDRLNIKVFDQYNQDPAAADVQAKTNWNVNYGRSTEVYSIGKQDGTCFDNSNPALNWNHQAVSGAPDWYDVVPCVSSGSPGVSCYTDVSVPVTVEGGVLGLKFGTTMTEILDTAGYAWSNIRLSFEPPTATPCCTGIRNDRPHKSCSAFHEERGCKAKGCTWGTADECSIPCCRFSNPRKNNKNKPQCKSFLLGQCETHPECVQSRCDAVGKGNNSGGK